jgi:hypothetical protein
MQKRESRSPYPIYELLRWQLSKGLGQSPGLLYCNSGLNQKKEQTMLTSFEGVIALRSLRLELQESAGGEFPESVLTELLVLRDVCKKLGLNVFQCQDVLSESGWAYVNRYLDTRVSIPVKNHRRNRFGHRRK